VAEDTERDPAPVDGHEMVDEDVDRVDDGVQLARTLVLPASAAAALAGPRAGAPRTRPPPWRARAQPPRAPSAGASEPCRA
jgi:hypothetical protein